MLDTQRLVRARRETTRRRRARRRAEHGADQALAAADGAPYYDRKAQRHAEEGRRSELHDDCVKHAGKTGDRGLVDGIASATMQLAPTALLAIDLIQQTRLQWRAAGQT